MFDIYVICLEKTKDNRCLPTIRSLENDKYKIIPFKAITPDDFNFTLKLNTPLCSNEYNKWKKIPYRFYWINW